MVEADRLQKGNGSMALAPAQFSYFESGVKTQLFLSAVVITHISKQESLFIVLSHVCTHERVRQKLETFYASLLKGLGGWCLF